jgi:hypothetical protein
MDYHREKLKKKKRRRFGTSISKKSRALRSIVNSMAPLVGWSSAAVSQFNLNFEAATANLQQPFHVHFQGKTLTLMAADYPKAYFQDIEATGRPQEGRGVYIRRARTLKLDERRHFNSPFHPGKHLPETGL